MISASPPLGVSAQASSAPDLALSRAAARSAQAVSNAASFSNHTLRCVAGSPANQNSRTSMALVMAFRGGAWVRRRGRFRVGGRRFLWNLYADLAMYRAPGAMPHQPMRFGAHAFRDTER